MQINYRGYLPHHCCHHYHQLNLHFQSILHLLSHQIFTDWTSNNKTFKTISFRDQQFRLQGCSSLYWTDSAISFTHKSLVSLTKALKSDSSALSLRVGNLYYLQTLPGSWHRWYKDPTMDELACWISTIYFSRFTPLPSPPCSVFLVAEYELCQWLFSFLLCSCNWIHRQEVLDPLPWGDSRLDQRTALDRGPS